MKKFRNILLSLSTLLMLCLSTGCQESNVLSPADHEDTAAKSQLISTDTEPGQVKPGSKIEESTSVSTGKLPEKTAIIEVINPVIDFGKLSPKDKATGTFDFKNSGTGTLEIKRVKSTCGCTVVDQAKMKKVYKPGESGSFSITYTASSSPGPVVKSITIYSNAVNKPTFKCQLKAMVEIAVTTEPKKFDLSFKAENGGVGPLKLKSSDGAAFKIVNFSSTNNAISADFDSNKAAEEFVLHPKVDMTKFTNKTLGGIINISLSHPKAKSIKVNYSVKPLWTTSPAKFLIMDAKPGETVQRSLFIKSNYGEKAEIESVSSRFGFVKVVSQKQDGNGVRMLVDIKPPEATGRPQRFVKDTLEIKLKTGDALDISCMIFRSKKTKRQ